MSHLNHNKNTIQLQHSTSHDELVKNSIFYQTYEKKRTQDKDDYDSDMDEYDDHHHLSPQSTHSISPPIYKGPTSNIDHHNSTSLLDHEHQPMEYELYQQKQQEIKDNTNNNNNNNTSTPNSLISKFKNSRIGSNNNNNNNKSNNNNKKIIISKKEMNRRIKKYLVDQYNPNNKNSISSKIYLEQLLDQYTTQEEIEEEAHRKNSLFNRLPDIMEGYLQLLVRFVLVGFFIFILFYIFSSILYDVNIKYKEYSLEIIKEVEKCSKQYNENKCNPITRIPAMETTCIQWELCMEKNPSNLPKSKILAEILSEVLDSFILNMSYKTMAFLITVIWMMIWIPNRLFDKPTHKLQHIQQNNNHNNNNTNNQHNITQPSTHSAPTHSIYAKNIFTLDPNHAPKLEQLLKD